MTSSPLTPNPPLHGASITKRMLQGAMPALVLVLLFLSGTGEPKPDWGPYWMLRPLVVVPIAGAMGGVFYYYLEHLRAMGGGMKVLAIIFSLIGYIIAIWLGFVLGFNGTYWN